MALLDTNVLIDLSKAGATEVSRRAYAFVAAKLSRGDTIYTSRINEAEFRVGQFRAADPVRETAKIEAVLAGCVVVEFDGLAARLFAEVKAHLLNIGRTIGDADVLIAAVALARRQSLITRNVRHFADVRGLVVESY